MVIDRPLPRISHLSQIDRLRLEAAGRRLAEAAQECSRTAALAAPPATIDDMEPGFDDLVEAFERLAEAQEAFWQVWWEACGIPAEVPTPRRSAPPAP